MVAALRGRIKRRGYDETLAVPRSLLEHAQWNRARPRGSLGMIFPRSENPAERSLFQFQHEVGLHPGRAAVFQG